LSDVIALGVTQQWAVLFAAHDVEVVEVASRTLIRELFVQAVDPVSGSRHMSYFVS
jgi:hypothetical protein